MAQTLEDLLDALEDVDDATREEASKALAELADPATLEALIGACGDEYWTVRAHAGWGVARIGGPRTSSASAIPPATMIACGSSIETAPARAMPRCWHGGSRAARAAALPRRAAAISSAPSAIPSRAAIASRARPEATRSSQPLRASPASLGSPEAQPNEQAPPCAPATIAPLASTADPMPVPMESRMASDIPKAAPAFAAGAFATVSN